MDLGTWQIWATFNTNEYLHLQITPEKRDRMIVGLDISNNSSVLRYTDEYWLHFKIKT